MTKCILMVLKNVFDDRGRKGYYVCVCVGGERDDTRQSMSHSSCIHLLVYLTGTHTHYFT